MGVALLDSSTIVGFIDAGDALHVSAGTSVWNAAEEHTFVASVVSLAELLTGVHLGHAGERTVREFFNVVVSQTLVLAQDEAERAAELRAGHKGLKLPDALILATADIKADVLITGDERFTKLRGLRCEVRYIGAG